MIEARSKRAVSLSGVQGHLAHKQQPPPLDDMYRRVLGIALLQGPKATLFLVSEVPLYFEHEEAHPHRSLQQADVALQGCLAHKKLPPPYDFHRALGIVLL